MPQFKTTHGMSRSALYKAWTAMLQRCENPNATSFERYGGAGIRVCDRWLDFANFVADMGVRPVGASLDRIDGGQGYEPGNCRWATAQEQLANRRPYGLSRANSSGVPGVYWKASHGRFVARATIGGKRSYLGFFKTLEEAEAAVVAARSA